jgi:hypothetical protein
MKRGYGWAAIPLLALFSVPAADLYYTASWGKGCARCHEIRPLFEAWEHATHRRINCVECHPSSLATNLRRVATHLAGQTPERPKLPHAQVLAMMDRCRQCHRQEFAQWQAGPHAATFARIFLDKEHNAKRPLMDDCLRCHGMHFEGSIGELVAPLNRQGPWQLKQANLALQPAIPCLACHAVHRQGAPLSKNGPPEKYRPSLGLFDRRSQELIPVGQLPLPLATSPDPRQGLCYQCHAPVASGGAGSGDDRTPKGVHAGLSCLACHQKHSQTAHASCATCHPRLSNCNRDVETMDTTFFDKKSRHNIHWVACADCHPKGVPPKKSPAARAAALSRAARETLPLSPAASPKPPATSPRLAWRRP